jgi:type III restriction enzyme
MGRRPAGYVKARPESHSFHDLGIFVELPLVNKICPRVKARREAGYPGVTAITTRLLEHWYELPVSQGVLLGRFALEDLDKK